jgi:hypothetical protein
MRPKTHLWQLRVFATLAFWEKKPKNYGQQGFPLWSHVCSISFAKLQGGFCLVIHRHTRQCHVPPYINPFNFEEAEATDLGQPILPSSNEARFKRRQGWE